MNARRKPSSPFREWRKKRAYDILPLFPPVGAALIKGFGVTLRTRFSGHLPVLDSVRSGEPFVLVFFHGRQFLLAQQLRDWPVAIMTSISYMGEIQSRILNRLGFTTIKGSRSRGGARVLARMVQMVKSGLIGAFAVDGPRGPYREVKPGAVYVAKKLRIPVVPVTTSAWPSIVLESVWDRYLLPLPFARTTVHFGKPMLLDAEMDPASMERDCRLVGVELQRLEKEADGITGRIRE